MHYIELYEARLKRAHELIALPVSATTSQDWRNFINSFNVTCDTQPRKKHKVDVHTRYRAIFRELRKLHMPLLLDGIH